MNTTWLNAYNPQTLQASNWLLYLNGFFSLLLLFRVGNALLALVVFVITAAYIYGGWGIANRKKLGYKVAVAAAFSQVFIRLLAGILDSGTSLISAILEAPGLQLLLSTRGVLSYMFEIALIGLLLHQQSREYQRIWFD